MNRIRKLSNDRYQILLTPQHQFDYNIETLLGNMNDFELKKYQIIETKTMEGAMQYAFLYPDIDWDRFVLNHAHIYVNLKNKIRNQLKMIDIKCVFESHLLSPEQLKNVVFDRVKSEGKRFTAGENLNDIISFKITNPISQNLLTIQRFLNQDKSLRIKNVIYNHGFINMIGQTELGSLYSIILTTPLLDNYAGKVDKKQLSKLLKQQDEIDTTMEFL